MEGGTCKHEIGCLAGKISKQNFEGVGFFWLLIVKCEGRAMKKELLSKRGQELEDLEDS